MAKFVQINIYAQPVPLRHLSIDVRWTQNAKLYPAVCALSSEKENHVALFSMGSTILPRTFLSVDQHEKLKCFGLILRILRSIEAQ